MASIKSKAHVSDTTTQASPTFPRARGLKPLESRIATNASGVRNNIENAPSVSFKTSGIASRIDFALDRATPCRTISVSEVDEKIAPSYSKRFLSSAANGRFPL